jgi:hypothetical protein
MSKPVIVQVRFQFLSQSNLTDQGQAKLDAMVQQALQAALEDTITRAQTELLSYVAQEEDSNGTSVRLSN